MFAHPSTTTPTSDLHSLNRRSSSLAGVLTPSTSFCADSQIVRLCHWLQRCSGRLGDVVGGIVEATAENIRLDSLSNFGRRHSCAVLPIHTPRHSVALEPLTPQPSRRLSRSNSVISDGNNSRSSSVASERGIDLQSSSRAQPSRQHSSCRSSVQSMGSLSSMARCAEQDRGGQDLGFQALILMKEQMQQVHQQLLDEVRFLSCRSFLLSTDESARRLLELCECLLFDWCSIWVSVHSDIVNEWDGGDTGGSGFSGAPPPDRSDDDLHRCLYLLLANAEMDWAVHKKEFMKWMVKLIGSGTIELLQLLTSVVPLMETVSARDAKFLVSCVVSSIDGTGNGDPVGALSVLISTLPQTFQVRQTSELLKPVWQEAVTHVLRVKNSRTHRQRLLDVLCSATMQSGSGSTEGFAMSQGTPLDSHHCSSSDYHSQCRVSVNFDSVESNDKQTILSRACREGDAELVKIMIARRAELGIGTFSREQSDGTNALQQATARGHMDVVVLLCSLPNEDIIPSFEAKVVGKGNVLQIAESMHREAIAEILVDRVPWLTSSRRKAALEAEQSQQLFASQDLTVTTTADPLASIQVIESSLHPTIDVKTRSGTTPPPDVIHPEDVQFDTPMTNAVRNLHTSRTPWTCALRAFLFSLEPPPHHGYASTIEAFTHDDAYAIQTLFDRSQPLVEVGAEQFTKDLAQLISVVRSAMQDYLQLPELSSGKKHRGTKDRNSQTRQSQQEQRSVAALHLLRSEDCAPQRDLTATVTHILSTVPASNECGKGSASGTFPLQMLLPGPTAVPIGAAFGMGRGDQAPMPSRVQRFLTVVASALKKTDETSVSIHLAQIAAADDWLLGSLRIDGMFPVVTQAVLPPACIVASPAIRKLVELRDPSVPPPLLARLLNGVMLILHYVVPSELQDAIQVRDALLASMNTAEDPIQHITMVQKVAKVSALATSINSTGELSLTSGHAYRFNVRMLTSRLFALHAVTQLHLHRQIFFGSAADTMFVHTLSQPSLGSDSSAAKWSAVFEGSVNQSTGSSNQSQQGERSVAHLFEHPLAALLWIGARTFSELDPPEILFGAMRVQAFGWLVSVISALPPIRTDGVSSSKPFLTDQSWWATLVKRIISPTEEVLFLSAASENLFPLHRGVESKELIGSFVSRLAACGDSALLQRVITAFGEAPMANKSASIDSLGWNERLCGLNALMLAMLCEQRAAVDLLVHQAKVSTGGGSLLRTRISALPASKSNDIVDCLWISRKIGDAETAMTLIGAFDALPSQ